MRYTRIFADEHGESHFEDVEIELSALDYAPPAPPLHLSSFIPASQLAFTSSPPGWFGDWHPSPRRQFFFQLAGELEVQVSDGEVRHFRPGAIVLVEDTTGKGHTTRVIGETEMQAVFVQLPESDA